MKKVLLCFLTCTFFFIAHAQKDPVNFSEDKVGTVLEQSTDSFSLEDASKNSLEFASSFKVFPNPVQNKLTLSGSNTIDSFKIYNVLGSLVLQGKSLQNSLEVNVSELQRGVYMLEVTSGGDKVTRKLIKK